MMERAEGSMLRRAARVVSTTFGFVALSVVLSILPEIVSRSGGPDAHGSLSAEATVAATHVIGNPRWILAGSIADDGLDWSQDRGLVFGDQTGELELDLGDVVELRGLLVQADADDRYSVETSVDGGSWGDAWEIGAEEGSGLRTRTRSFERPLYTRYVRIRASGAAYGELSAITALRVYAELPESWPDAPEAVVVSPPAAFPWLTLREVGITKAVLGWLGAALLVTLVALRRTSGSGGAMRAAKYALVAVAVVAGTSWWDFFQLTNQDYNRQRHHYAEAFHYYLGSKYAEELGYTKLYTCYMAVDFEDGLRSFQLRRHVTRDLTTNELVPTRTLAPTASDDCKASFTAERWEQYRADVAWLRAHTPPRMWIVLGRDHGYNPSPLFTMVAGAIASVIPLSEAGFLTLISLDTVLLLAMWLLVFHTFGWFGASAALLFWGTNLLGNDRTFLVGAFLRQDALFAMVVGVCFLRRGNMRAGGFALAYATLLRVFPGFLLGGVGLKILAEMILQRRFVLSAAHRRFVVGALTALGLAVVGPFVSTVEPGAWLDFARNLSKHRATAQLQNVGARTLAVHIDQPKLLMQDRVGIDQLEGSYARHANRAYVVVVGAVLVLPLLLVAACREEDWVAAVLGLVWLPFVTDVNNYYWSMLLLFGLLAARGSRTVAFALLITGFSVLGVVFGYLGLGLYVWASLLILMFFGWVTLSFALPKVWERRPS